MMNKKGKINGSMYDVVNFDQYQNNKALYDNKFTAIEEDGLLYPITNNKKTPGYYHNEGDLFGQFIEPDQTQLYEYSNENIIDFNSVSSMKEIVEKSIALRDMEKEILCSSDNKFKPVIDEKDDLEMRALKEAIIAKNIDLDSYEHRFGPNYNNDKRLFKKNSMSLRKMKTFGNALDMRITLTIQDKNNNVANPIGRVITVDITGGDDDEE